MIQSIIERAKERFEKKLERLTRESYTGQYVIYPHVAKDELQDFLETEIRTAVREVLEEVKEVHCAKCFVQECSCMGFIQDKINEILNEKE